MKRNIKLFLVVFLAAGFFIHPVLSVQDMESSSYHLFLDYDFAVTLEVVEDGKQVTPILNIIAFGGGSWEISPPDVKILNKKGLYAADIRFSFDTGDGSLPYVSTYMKIGGGEYIGVDLIGDFKDYREPKLARIRIGNEWLDLKPVGPEAFDTVLNGLNLLDLRDPDLVTTFEKLDLPLIGSRVLIDE
ncbi:MAG: hypothetical protein ABIJ42_02865 [Acidobacteriota bacterium]